MSSSPSSQAIPRRAPALIALVVALACVLGGCPRNPCPYVSVTDVPASSGEIEWQWDGSSGPLPVRTGDLRAEVETAACRGGLYGDRVYGSTGDAGAILVAPRVGVTCRDERNQTIQIAFHDLPDLRTLDEGRREVTSNLVIGISVGEGGPGCLVTPRNVRVVLEVIEATDGAAPWPDLVTPDYHRRVRLHFDVGPVTDPAGGEACARPIEASGQFEFTQSAADFEPHLDAICPHI